LLYTVFLSRNASSSRQRDMHNTQVRPARYMSAMDIEKERCQFCGKPAKHFLFAAFVCDDEECIEKARVERGGPGGHMKKKLRDQGVIRIPKDE